MNALDDLVRAGKVLYLGISDTPAWIVSLRGHIRRAAWLDSVHRPAGPLQPRERTVERELLPMARGLDLAVTGWAPLGGGLLTGRYGSDRERPTDTRLAGIGGKYEEDALSERNLLVADALNEVAEARGATSSQVAIAWVRAQQHRAVTIPIVGTRTCAQLVDNLAACEIELERAELARLDEASRVAPGFPANFGGASMAHGDTFERVDDHRKLVDALV